MRLVSVIGIFWKVVPSAAVLIFMTVWLVWRDGYPGLGGDCGYLKSWLDMLRGPGTTAVSANGYFYENENLVRYSS